MISYTNDTTSATITISGEAFENLARLVRAVNETEWCDCDNSAADLLENFIVGPLVERLEMGADRVKEIGDEIISAIDTGFQDGTPEDTRRKRELSAAFHAAVVREG